MNDNVQTMIERYRRELIEFNKRNPQKMTDKTQLTDSKIMAVEAAMTEKDEMNRNIPKPQTNMPQMPQANTLQSNNVLEETPENKDMVSEYENSKLYIELNAADNNANGSDNNHRVMDRIRPETGLTRLETRAVMAVTEPAKQVPDVMRIEQVTMPSPEETVSESALFEKNAQEYPPYSSGSVRTYPSLEAFQQANTKSGSLRVQVAAAEQSFPVSNAEVAVTKDFDGKPHVFYRVFTDISGVATGMTLAAPDKALSSYPSVLAPYATYDVTVSHPRYVTVIQRSCAIFDGIETIQFCEMVPRVGSAEQYTVFEEQPVIK